MAYAPSLAPTKKKKRNWWDSSEPEFEQTPAPNYGGVQPAVQGAGYEDQYQGPQGGGQIQHPQRGIAPPITANPSQMDIPEGPERGAEYEQEQLNRYGTVTGQPPPMSSQTMGEDPLEAMHREAGTTPMQRNEYDVSGTTPMAPNLTPDQQHEQNYQKERDIYEAKMKAGGKAPGKGKQILFHIAQAMSNFAAGLQGQPMQPHQNLKDVRDVRAREQAGREFEPYEKERQRRIEDTNLKLKQQQAQQAQQTAIKEGRLKDLEIQKREYENAHPDMETRTAEDKVWVRPKGADPSSPWTEQPQLREPTKTPMERQLPKSEGGQTYHTTGEKVAANIAKVQEKQAEIALQKGRITQDQKDDFTRRHDAWTTKKVDIENQKGELNSQADTEDGTGRSKLTEAGGYDEDARAANAEGDLKGAATAKAAARKARQESQAAQDKAKSLRRRATRLKVGPEPKLNLSSVSTPEITTGSKTPTRPKKTITKAQFDAAVKGSGKSPEEMMQLMKDDKNFEYIIQQ